MKVPMSTLTELIKDAEWRIGSYISGGGHSDDLYVQDQLKKIFDWTDEIHKRRDSG